MRGVKPVNATKNRRVAFAAFALFAFMVGMAYAAVPLYRLFCQQTGFAGTPLRAETAPISTSERTIKVRFDANVAASLPWKFYPKQLEMTVKLGEINMAYYLATNISDKPVTGSATYNVSPDVAGGYFSKIHCFCFEKQSLAAGETVEMPVEFFVDEELDKDPSFKKIDTITLSYSFYRSDAAEAVSEASRPPGLLKN